LTAGEAVHLSPDKVVRQMAARLYALCGALTRRYLSTPAASGLLSSSEIPTFGVLSITSEQSECSVKSAWVMGTLTESCNLGNV